MKRTTILMLGDVTGPAAADYVAARLWRVREEHGASFVVANAENVAPGNGIDNYGVKTLIGGGCDVLTTGNHVFKRREAKNILEDTENIIRPCNYPSFDPGRGHVIADADGVRVLVINVMGVIYMEPLENPFRSVSRILREEEGKYDICLIDVHAEATSEKLALAYYYDGRAGAVVGTHTHVPTADEQILPKGTAYVTDLGMCGPKNSVLGVKPENIIERMTKNMPVKFELSENATEAHGVKIVFGEDGRAESIERIKF